MLLKAVGEFICLLAHSLNLTLHTHTHIATYSVVCGRVEKVVQETCYEVVFEDGSVCKSLPASEIVKVRKCLQVVAVCVITAHTSCPSSAHNRALQSHTAGDWH